MRWLLLFTINTFTSDGNIGLKTTLTLNTLTSDGKKPTEMLTLHGCVGSNLEKNSTNA